MKRRRVQRSRGGEADRWERRGEEVGSTVSALRRLRRRKVAAAETWACSEMKFVEETQESSADVQQEPYGSQPSDTGAPPNPEG